MSEQYSTPPAAPAARPRRLLPLVLIGIGLLVLVSNAGPLGSMLWSVLWPIGLVAVGVDLITEGRQRRRIGISALLSLVVLAPLIGGARLMDGGSAELRNDMRGGAESHLALGDVDRVRAEIHQMAGELEIGALPDDSSAVVRINDEGRIKSRVVEDRIGELDVTTREHWGGDVELQLTRGVPLDLTIDLAAGSAKPLNFEELQLEKLDLKLRTGEAEVLLPERGVMDVMVSGDVGSVQIRVPEELPAQIILESGIGETEYDEDRFREENGVLVSEGYSAEAPNRATIRINNSVGEIEIK